MENEKCSVCEKEMNKCRDIIWRHGKDNKPTCEECHDKLRAEIKTFWCSDCHNWLPFDEIGLVGCSRDRCNKCYGARELKMEVSN